MLKFNVDKDNILLVDFLRDRLNTGKRTVKHLINSGSVLVNSRICKTKNFILNKRDKVEIKKYIPYIDIDIIDGNGLFYGVYKPPFIHSTRGKSDPNMEDILESYFNRKIFVLNRLDFLTSGILLFGFSEKAKEEYKDMQDMGLIEKRYIALVTGCLSSKMCIKNLIIHDNRKKVKVSKEIDEDKLRHTIVVPIEFLRKNTLVEAIILKGKRHQIRAHLSFIGHPIVGDPLYGTGQKGNKRMYLHNFLVKFPRFELRVKKEFKE